MRKLIFFIAALFIVPAVCTAAEEKISVEEVVVTASRLEEPVEQTTSNVTVINREQIEAMNVEFVTEILRKIPEVNVVQNGGAGKVATVILRGGNSTHALVMVDGVKVNSPTTGSFDFSSVSVDEIERIEIVKGPQSTIYGSEAMSGVINIITKKGSGNPRISGLFETGPYSTYKPSLNVSGSNSRVDYRLTASCYSTDGMSAAKQGSERDGYESASVSGKIGIKFSEKFEAEFTGRHYYDRSELDGFDFFERMAVDDVNFVQHRHHYTLSGIGKLYLVNGWEQILTVSRVSDNMSFRDPDTAFNNAEIESVADTLDWQNNLYIADSYILTAGAEYRDEDGKNSGNFDEAVENIAFYLNNRLSLMEESLILNAGLRYDDNETFGSKTTYRVGALYNISPSGLKIKAGYSTGFRAPKLNELYFPFYGNVRLEPEESSSWEIGIGKDFLDEMAGIEITYFNQHYRNLIQTDPLTFTAANIAKADVKGIEVNCTIKPADKLSFSAGYAYLDSQDRETGDRLPLRPENKFSFSADFRAKDFSVSAYYTYVGSRFDSSVSRELSSYSLVNLSGSYRLAKWLTLFARIDNLFDEEYEEAGSFSTLGFSVFGGVKITSL